MVEKKSLLTVVLTSYLLLLLAPSVTWAVDGGDKKLLEFLKTEHAPCEPLLPVDVRITDGFKPGNGIPVGAVQMIHGTVLVFHKGSKIAYRLEGKMPIFRGDTLVSEIDSRVTLLMSDKSALTLTARSKLLIDKSFYDLGIKTNTRDTKLQLLFGRLRAIVSKITGDSDYTITTPTAVAGVRGTDFALNVACVFKKPSECESFPLLSKPDDTEETDQFIQSFMTALVTGKNNSIVEFSGIAGTPITVDSLSVSCSVSGCSADNAVRIGPKALDILNNIAPEADRLQNFSATKLQSKSQLLQFMSNRYQWRKLYPADKFVPPPLSPIQPR